MANNVVGAAKRFGKEIKEEWQRTAKKTEEALRNAADHPILDKIGDNTTNQYRKTGHHT